MTRPDDIPQDVWDIAIDATQGFDGPTSQCIAVCVIVSRAILSAKAKEREACAQMAWDIAEGRQRQKGEAIAAGRKREGRDYETMAISANDVRFHILKREGAAP